MAYTRGPYRRRFTDEERFWQKVDKSGDCWLWTASVNNQGYGQLGLRGADGVKFVLAHRFSLALALGRPIADRMEACHTCDTPRCVRPEHLFEATHRDNFLDASRKGRLWNRESRKTHCKRGHELLGDNVRYEHKPNGQVCRSCRVCAKLLRRERDQRRRSAA